MGESWQLVGSEWSPSGRYLAALANLRDSMFSYVPVVFTPDGEFVALGRPSTEFPEPMAWSPDDVLAYAQGEAPYRITEVFVLNPAVGAEQHLVTAGGADYPIILDMAWSPGGRWLALVMFESLGEGRVRTSLRVVDATGVDPSLEFEVETSGVNRPLVGWVS